jgi:5'-deoxynucleotidase YfbR-like HD superfamily hydrolase
MDEYCVCEICKNFILKEDTQELQLFPINILHQYHKWFGKELDVGEDLHSQNNKAIVCYNCATRYVNTQSSVQLNIMNNYWDKLSIKDDLFSILLLHGRKLSYLMRFAGSIKIHEESVAEHSYWTTLLAFSIWQNYFKDKKISLEDLFLTAMFHDWSEIITSDIIDPLKIKIKELYNKVEDKIIIELSEKINLSNLQTLMDEFNKKSTLTGIIVSFADKLSCYLYINEECKLGNQNFRENLVEKIEGQLHTIVENITLGEDIKEIFKTIFMLLF